MSELAAKSDVKKKVLNLVHLYRGKRLKLQQICDQLNELGYKTSRDKRYQAGSIAILLKGAEKRKAT